MENRPSLQELLCSLILTDEECKNHPQKELFHVFLNHRHIGPLRGQSIKALLSEETTFPPKTLVRSRDQENWTPLFEHPFFQRRKTPPKGEKEQIKKTTDSYHLLVHGQKRGPFKGKEIREKIEGRQIPITHMISADNGKSWSRIFEMEAFDRRALKINLTPPSLPKWEELQDSEKEVETNLKKAKQASVTETIASLAHLGNLETKHYGGSLSFKRHRSLFPPWMGKRSALLAVGTGISVLAVALILEIPPSLPPTTPTAAPPKASTTPPAERPPSPSLSGPRTRPPSPQAPRERPPRTPPSSFSQQQRLTPPTPSERTRRLPRERTSPRPPPPRNLDEEDLYGERLRRRTRPRNLDPNYPEDTLSDYESRSRLRASRRRALEDDDDDYDYEDDYRDDRPY